MKKYIVFALCIITSLSGMEEKKSLITQPIREAREWDAEAYEAGNALQTTGFFRYLATNNIKTENKTILSLGCGTGKIENILVEKATSIHGIDASKNMIDFAQNKYGSNKKLSFQHCFAEDFKTQKLYQLAIASFCIHWFEDKKQAFQRINDSLELGGEFFGSVVSSDNQKPVSVVVFLEMASTLDWLRNIVINNKLTDLTGSSYPSEKELRAMLAETNFEIITCAEQSFTFTMDDRDTLAKIYWPVLASRPIMKLIPNELKETFFENFIDRMIEKLEKHENGSISETFPTTIVHARKIKK